MQVTVPARGVRREPALDTGPVHSATIPRIWLTRASRVLAVSLLCNMASVPLQADARHSGLSHRGQPA